MAVPPPLPDTIDKPALRRELRARRAAFVAGLEPTARAEALAVIDRHLAPLLGRAGPIAGYVAHKGEADVLPFLLAAFHAGHRIALPHVPEGSPEMHFLDWHPDAALQPGLAGIPQPAAHPEEIRPAIVLAPLVGFDRRGARIGQGAGYYDRWFARHPDATRIGIAWSVQEVADIPADPWDMPLHAVVTEKEWIAI